MSLSLDMIGKFVLVTLMIAVVTGLIVGFQSDIKSAIGGIMPGNDDPGGDAETVEISSNAPAGRIAPLVDSCYKRHLENSFEDYVCFIVSSDSGSISFSGQNLENKLSEDVKEATDIKNDYDSSTIVIRHSEGKIKVD